MHSKIFCKFYITLYNSVLENNLQLIKIYKFIVKDKKFYSSINSIQNDQQIKPLATK